MNTYKVWDDEQETADQAIDLEALSESDAAEKYAEEDCDGESDGIYESGRRIGVQDKDGNVTKWKITAEYSPTYYAMPWTDLPRANQPSANDRSSSPIASSEGTS